MNILKSTGGLIANLSKATQKLSELSTALASGKRINKASDDAAGLAVVSALEADSAVYSKARDNVAYGDSLVSIADGALQSQSDISVRMSELATQSANGTLNDEQRQSLNQEYQALKEEYNRISETTEFNGQKVFADGGVSIQAGLDSGSNSQISISTQAIAAPGGDISSQAGALAAIDSTRDTISANSAARGRLGADQSRLQQAGNNIDNQRIESEAAAARIRDVDIAETTARSVAERIRQQGTAAILGQAGNINANVVSKLLGA
jgi:flagellin